jgi:hypothetical protein
MAINLVSLVMQFLTPDMIGRIASALGLDRNNTQTAIGAAIPGLLAGLSDVAAQPGGAQKLAEAARQQTGTLGNFASMIGTGAKTSLIEKGSQMLSSLLGGRDQTALAASAQVALPKLQEVTAQIDKVNGVVGQLSAEQRRALAGLVSPMMLTLNQLFDKVLAIPGVSEVLKPTIDALRAKLAVLTA